MTEILNSSNLVVRIDNATPTPEGTGPWGSVSYPQGNIKNPVAYQRLAGSVGDVESAGTFALNGLLFGIRGTIEATVLVGATGADRSIGYLAQTLGASNRILLAMDAMNRPFCLIQDASGVTVAKVIPTWTSNLVAGQQVTIRLCWDSTQAIDGTRFAVLMIGPNKATGTDWMTNPTTTWTSFAPGYIVLGDAPSGGGAPALSGFNGQILSFQVSNSVVTSGSTGSFTPTRVLDRVISDVIVGTTT